MVSFEFDWHYIRRHTARPVISTIITLAVLLAALWMHGRQAEQYSDYSASYTKVRGDFNKLIADQRMVERYQRRYEHFREIGFVGPESRLDWIETVRTTAESLALPHVNYAIEPQLEVVAPVKSSRRGNDTQISVSRAQLELGLNHELELLRFFDELQQEAPGLIKIDECGLTWQSDIRAQLAPGNNLTAICRIQIYSVITSDFREEEA